MRQNNTETGNNSTLAVWWMFIDVDQMHLHRRRTNLHLQLFLLFPVPALSTIPTADVADLVGTKAAPHLLSSSSSSSVESGLAKLKF